MARVAVIHTGGIGDFLLFCPALACLSEGNHVALFGQPERLAIASWGQIAQEVHPLDAIEFSSVFSTPSARLVRFAQSFDRHIVWMNDVDGAISTALHRAGARDVQVFPGLPPATYRRHASNYYLEMLGFSIGRPFRLPALPVDPQWDLLIHPGSGSARKNWPIDRFIAVADAFQQQGCTAAWLTGPAEGEMLLPAGEVIRPESLAALRMQLVHTRAYLGNDSGVTHLAAACGLPTVAVFGPTDPTVWAPLGEQVRGLQGTPWPSPAAVINALSSFVVPGYGV